MSDKSHLLIMQIQILNGRLLLQSTQKDTDTLTGRGISSTAEFDHKRSGKIDTNVTERSGHRDPSWNFWVAHISWSFLLKPNSNCLANSCSLILATSSLFWKWVKKPTQPNPFSKPLPLYSQYSVDYSWSSTLWHLRDIYTSLESGEDIPNRRRGNSKPIPNVNTSESFLEQLFDNGLLWHVFRWTSG